MNDEAIYRERFWRSETALQAFVRSCWEACGKKKRLTREQADLLEKALYQIYILRRQERDRKKREYLIREEKRRKKSLT